ncbi:MAG TPA: head GIN domain-containing protein [Chitinophagaceae bacterium]|nr:head GIN domain-containing protein [Chitinophagaceae bacterium]
MKKFLFLPLLLLSVLASAQQINDPNAQKRNVPSFQGIDVGTGIRLLLTQGSSEEVVVSADKLEYRDRIVTKVEHGILKIHYDTQLGAINRKNESRNLRAYVSYKALDKLFASTGAEVELKSVLSASSLELRASTGAIVNGQIATGSLKVDQSTGSRIRVSGTAHKLEAEGSTGSRFEGEGLRTESCTVAVSTGARLSITAEKELQVKASTGGVVNYKGNAPVREFRTNTGGTVSKI